MQTTASGPILAIDSAGSSPGLALVNGGRVVAERYPETAAGNNEELAVALGSLFEEAGRRPAELAGIGVTLGPGSYTGLRVGLALARGLALTDSLPAFGMGSLELMVHCCRQAGPVVAASDAGGGRAYLARFDGSGCEDPEPALVEKEGLVAFARAEGRPLLVEQALAVELPEGLAVTVPDHRAGQLALETALALAAGRGVEAAALMPLYAGPAGARPNRDRIRVSS